VLRDLRLRRFRSRWTHERLAHILEHPEMKEMEKAIDSRIVFSPLNKAFVPIVIPPEGAEHFRILAEFIAVLRSS